MPDFLPRQDGAFRQWTFSFRNRLIDSYEVYGITADQSADYSAAWEDFNEKYRLSQGNSTRTPSGILAKDQSREKLETMTRVLARIIRANPSLTPDQLFRIGLGGREASGALIPAPTEAPSVGIHSVMGKTVTLQLKNKESFHRRRRPSGVLGAAIYSFVGETPPPTLNGWKMEFTTTSLKPQVKFGANLAVGTKVWLTAQWLSPRLEAGPASAPIEGYLQYGLARAG